MAIDEYQRLYTVGNIISLHVKALHSVSRVVQAKIIQLHEPFTLSCVATVEINASDFGLMEPSIKPVKAILKLYDRRFAGQLRKDEKIEPWTETTEQAYVETVNNGTAVDFIRKLRDDNIDFEEPEEGWSAAENEAYLYEMCSDLFSTEIKAYEVLQALQGKQIPKLHSRVSLALQSKRSDDFYEQDDNDLLSIPGILLEYIPGPTLSNMTDVIPQQSWQRIVDQAIDIVRAYSRLGILNKDVRCSNFVIDGAVRGGDEHRVVMLDFALCGFKGSEQSEQEWGRAKWRQDEEGAVGAVMKTRLAKVGFELKYTPSNQWIEYAEREGDENS